MKGLGYLWSCEVWLQWIFLVGSHGLSILVIAGKTHHTLSGFTRSIYFLTHEPLCWLWLDWCHLSLALSKGLDSSMIHRLEHSVWPIGVCFSYVGSKMINRTMIY